MLIIWLLTCILANSGVPIAMTLWNWFGLHPFATILMIILLC
jgi:hypothetical protein